MYLRKRSVPRVITLPDGSTMSLADLPPEDTKRWVVSRKAAVVKGVLSGLLSKEDALERYGISSDEFETWVAAVNEHGLEALKATMTQKYRQPSGSRVKDGK